MRILGQFPLFLVLAGLAACDDDRRPDSGPRSNLPVLYRVDQPTSNVVVFRGADVALARAAGLLPKRPTTTNYRPRPRPSYPPPTTPAPAPPPPTTTAYTTTTTEAPTYPTTTTPPPPPPPTRPAYRPAPSYSRPSYKPRPPTYNYPQYKDVPAHYNWEYEVRDSYSGNNFGHKESREGYRATGKYYVTLPDGRLQIVTYVADENGYVPTVVYEGTASQYPSS